MNQKKLNDALLKAAQDGLHTEVTELIGAGATIDVMDWQQLTPLLRASRNGHTETCRVLLESGSEIDAKDEEQWTPLHHAAWNGHTETCLRLIEAGATIDARSHSQWTPLHRAARRGYTEICCVLIKSGANIDAKDEQQWTPLHRAEWTGHTETCLALIAFGACRETLIQNTNLSDEIKALTGITVRQASVLGGQDARLLDLLKNHPSDREDDQVPALIALAEKHQKDKTALVLRAHRAQCEANITLKELGLCGP